MDFVRRNFITELEPNSVQKVDLLRREVGCVRSKVKDLVLSARKIELKRDFGFWIGQALPRQTRDTCILNDGCIGRGAQGNSRRLQALRSAQNGFPFVGRGGNGQVNGLSFLFRDLESACE